jgi:translation initiation factor 5A
MNLEDKIYDRLKTKHGNFDNEIMNDCIQETVKNNKKFYYTSKFADNWGKSISPIALATDIVTVTGIIGVLPYLAINTVKFLGKFPAIVSRTAKGGSKKKAMMDISYELLLKKGDTVVLEGAACTVTDVKISRPGKHGHAKVNFMAVGLLDKKKRNSVMPGHDDIEVPIIGKKNAQVLSITGDTANVMDSETYESFDLVIPEELKDELQEGMTIVYWTILSDKVMKQIKPE